MSHSTTQSKDYPKSDITVDSLITFNGKNNHRLDDNVPPQKYTTVLDFKFRQVLDLRGIIIITVLSQDAVFRLFSRKWKQKQKSLLMFHRVSFQWPQRAPNSSIFQKLNKQLLSSICFDLIQRGIIGRAASATQQKWRHFFQRALGHGANGNTF